MATFFVIVRIILGVYLIASLASFVYCFKHDEIKFTDDEIIKSIHSTACGTLLFIIACLI